MPHSPIGTRMSPYTHPFTRWVWMLGLCMVSFAHAQPFSFGENRLSPSQEPWFSVRTDSVVVYSQGRDPHLATWVAREADRIRRRVEAQLGIPLGREPVVVVYPTYREFLASTAMPPSEYAIGGALERRKNSILVPFLGDSERLRHTLAHELVHVALAHYFEDGALQTAFRSTVLDRIPLWFTEGLAEFIASVWTVEAEMHLRAAVLAGRPLDRVLYSSSYDAYWAGQSFWMHLVREYGKEVIPALLNGLRQQRNLDEVWETVTGNTEEDLVAQWVRHVLEITAPELAARTHPSQYGREVRIPASRTGHRGAPIVSPFGDQLAYVESNGHRLYVEVRSSSDGRLLHRVALPQRIPRRAVGVPHQLPLAWHPGGRELVLAAADRKSALLLRIDPVLRRAVEVPLDALSDVYALDWHPDGTQLALAGSAGGRTGVWTYSPLTDTLAPLWQDGFDVTALHWDAAGSALLFASDRGGHPVGSNSKDPRPQARAPSRIYRFDVASRSASPLTSSPSFGRDYEVFTTLDGEVRVRSSRNGLPNLYRVAGPDSLIPLTNTFSGFQYLRSARLDGGLMALSPGSRVLWMISSALPDLPPIAPTVWANALDAPVRRVALPEVEARNPFLRPLPPAESAPFDGVDSLHIAPYRLVFGADVLTGSASTDPRFGVQALAQLQFSDVLGRHRMSLASNLLVDLRSADYEIAYTYLGTSIDQSLHGFHVSRVLYRSGESRSLYRYRHYGGSARLGVPIDAYRRITLELGLVGASQTNLFDPTEAPRDRLMLHPALTFEIDRTLPGVWGPREGIRAGVYVAGVPLVLSGTATRFITGMGEVRLYAPLPRYATLVLRTSAGISAGNRPQRFYTAGAAYWLNPSLTNPSRNTLPTETDFAFATPIAPVRGFALNQQSGSVFGLVNGEVRLPTAFRHPLLRAPQLTLFADAALATSVNAPPPVLWSAGKPQDVLLSAGVGTRAFVLGLPLRLDLAWPLTALKVAPPQVVVSLGRDF